MAVRIRFSRTNTYPPAYLHFGIAPPIIEASIATGLAVSPMGIAGDILRLGIFIIGYTQGPYSYTSGILAQRNIVSNIIRTAYSQKIDLPYSIRSQSVHLPFTAREWRAPIPIAFPGDSGHRGHYTYSPILQNGVRTTYDLQDDAPTSGRIRYDLLGWASAAERGRYGIPGSMATAYRTAWPYLTFEQITRRATYFSSGQIETTSIARSAASRDMPIHILCRYGLLINPPWIWPRERRPRRPRPVIPTIGRLFFYRTNDQPATVPLHFGKFLVPPSKRIIIMTPTCTVVRLPDRLALSVSSLSISEQIDSYAKTFNLETNWAGIQALFEGALTPTPIEATINDHVWVLVAETYTESAKFGERSYTVTGFCQSILLSSPHSALRSYTEENTRTAEQLAAQELPIGWTLSWQIVNWEVPAGVWTYQDLSPIEAISRLAQAAGAFIQSHLTDKTLSILPTYTTSSWAMDEAILDAILAGEVQFNVTVEQPARPNYVPYNGAFVSGTTQGVAGLIRIPSTQGERQLLVSSDSLILEINVLRERGREELSMNYPRPTLSVQVPLMPPPGSPQLIRPGDIVEVRTEYAIFRDIVVSTDISVSIQNDGLVIRQVLKVGNSVANPWVAIDSLNPRSPLLSSGVLAHNADGTSTVELPGGTQIRVFGQSVAVGLRAFIQDGLIIGEAPDLPTFTLDAFDAAP